MGEEEHAIVCVVRPEDIWIGSYLIETAGDRKEAYSKIMETYEEYAKDREVYLNYPSWIDETIAEAWKPARNNMRLVEIFMLLSIIISLLGLLAMSTYYADEKSRDIAVRKVFGGTVDSEAWRTIRDYMILVGIACVIGIPIAGLCRAGIPQRFHLQAGRLLVDFRGGRAAHRAYRLCLSHLASIEGGKDESGDRVEEGVKDYDTKEHK